MKISKSQVTKAEASYSDKLCEYGPDNQATLRAEISLRQIRDAYAAQQQIKAVRAEMKAAGVKRSSFMNGGHSPESYRLNARMFELETVVKRVVA